MHHQGIAKRVGVRPEQLEAWDNNPVFTDQEQAVIRHATEATQHIKVSDDAFDALRNFLDAEQIVQLVMIVAHYNRAARILVPLDIALESDAHESRYN